MEQQVVSRQRVADHGEVYTNAREVNAMLDLVEAETLRIESRFLEPACGTGNFLAEILRRKLDVVQTRYSKSQLEWERNAVLAVSSVYGIDILQDNAIACRARLFQLFDEDYTRLYRERAREACRETVRFILGLNIVWGDALTLQTVGEKPRSIVFPEWSFVGGSQLQRRDYMFSFLVEKLHQLELFGDEGEVADISQPVKEYPLAHFLEIAETE